MRNFDMNKNSKLLIHIILFMFYEWPAETTVKATSFDYNLPTTTKNRWLSNSVNYQAFSI